MTLMISLAIDLFHLRWDTPTGELWLCLRPQIATADQLTAAQGIERAQDFAFEIIRADSGQLLEPIPLPTGLDPILTLQRAAGSEVLRINRSTQAIVTDGDLFTAANRTAKDWVASPAPTIQLRDNEPFATIYNETLRMMAHDRNGQDEVQSQLRVGLNGGTRRVVDPAFATGLASLMLIDGNPLGRFTTNLHSLLGLCVKIGDKGNLADLQAIENIALSFELSDGSTVQTDLGTMADQTFFTGFFSAISAALPNSPLISTWSADFAGRVYVNDTPTTTSQAAYGGILYYRLTPPKEGYPATLSSKLKRLEVRALKNGPAVVPGTGLTVRLHRSVRCRLAPYRKFPSLSGAQKTLLRLTPESGDEAIFAALLMQGPQVLATARIIDSTNQVAPAGALTFVGAYEFDWDDAGAPVKTVLFLGQRPDQWNSKLASPSVLLIVPVKVNSLPVEVSLAAAGTDPLDPFGPRWESTSFAPLARQDFDMIEGVPPLPALTAPEAFFESDADYDFSQSASRIEGLLTVNYPIGARTLLPDDEYLDDLINHNALNISARWGTGPTIELNPDSQTYPVASAGHGSGAPFNAFHLRRQQSVDFSFGQTGVSARSFYANLYGLLGKQRVLSFEVEHLYGSTIDLSPKPALSTFADWAPALPTDAQRDSGATSFTFLDAALLADGKTLRLTFRFQDLTVLAANTDTQSWATVKAAWRSVAELSEALSIKLVTEFWRFDANAALSNPRKRAGTFASAFAEIEQPPKDADITGQVKPLAATWLTQPPVADVTVDVPIAPRDPRDFGAISNGCGVSLVVTRRPGVAPLTGTIWTPKRYDRALGSANPFNSDGLMVLDASEALPAVATYVENLRVRQDTLRVAKAAETANAVEFRKMSGAAQSWIIPQVDREARRGRVRAAVVPISFLPVARDPVLGARTGMSLARHLQAVQVIIDAQPTTWAASWDDVAWRALFDGLQVNHDDIVTLLRSPARLAYPLPEQGSLPTDATDVDESIDALLTSHSELAKVLGAWLDRTLLARPSLYADAKALLLSHLRPSGAPVIPADLYQLRSGKTLGPLTGSPTEEDSLTLDQAAAASGGMVFIDTLDNKTYGNEFHFNDLKLPTFEASLAQAAAQAGEPFVVHERSLVPLEALIVPSGVDPLDGTVKMVTLAARAPVEDPVWLKSRVMDPQEADPLSMTVGSRYTFDSVLACAPVAAAATDLALVLKVRSAAWSQSTLSDKYCALTLYLVRGDEETGWQATFENDQFYVAIDSFDAASISKSVPAIRTPTDDAKILDFFDGLQAATDLPSFSGLIAAVDNAVITRATAMFTPAAPVSLPQNAGNPITINGTSGTIELPPGSPVRGAYLLQANQPGSTDQSVGFYLLLATELPLWHRHTISLLQTRNRNSATPEPGSRFAAPFGEASEKVTAGAAFSVARTRNLSGRAPVVLAARSMNADVLVAQLIANEIDPGSTDWMTFRRSILISHEQRVAAPIAFPGSPDAKDVVDRATSPIANIRIAANQPSVPNIVFDAAFKDFVIDIQWQSATNLQFFRIEGIRVRFL